MTGYGSGHATVTVGDAKPRFDVDIRAVNHRFLDVRVRLPDCLQEHATGIEAHVRKRLRRGRAEVHVRVNGGGGGLPRLDVSRARAAFQQLEALRDEIAPHETVPLALLASVHELFAASPGDRVGFDVLEEVMDAACDELDRMRTVEGTALAEDLARHLESVRAKLAQMRLLSPGLVAAYRARLRERLDRFLADTAMALDQGRLEHEVAIFADRSDIAEEVARLTSHCDQFGELMQGPGRAHGRKLDFLLQEMGREVNTMGSKVADVAVTRVVVELKADIERMREQAQNVL